MSAKLRIDNFASNNRKAQTSLSADVAALATTLNVYNAAEFANGDFVFLGDLGSETCEKVTLSAASGTTLTSGATTLNHKENEAVNSVYGDQIKVYRASNVSGLAPVDTSFASIATINIAADQLYTDYVDSGGGSGFWYKYTYYNSGTTSETPIADSIPVRGAGYGHYCSIDMIKTEAGFQDNQNVLDSSIDLKRSQAEGIIDGYLAGKYTTPFPTSPVPPLIQSIAILIAAGYLMTREYGEQAAGTDKDGQSKIKEGMELLEMVKDDRVQVLDAAGNSLLLTEMITGWPDTTTATKDITNHGGDVIFPILKVF